jgi:lipopolysaccharide/colanic/teichoic acid biosynthesis glycosyltransferase
MRLNKLDRVNAPYAMREAVHIRRWILAGDLLWTVFAFVAAGYFRYGYSWDDTTYHAVYALLPFLAVSVAMWTILFYRMKLDGFEGGWWLPSVASGLFLAVVGQMSLLLAAAYLTRQYVSRLALAYYGLLLFPGFLLVRHVVRRSLRGRHACGDVCRVVIAGSGHIAREIASKIANHPEMLCRVVGFLFPEDRADDNIAVEQGSASLRDVSTLEVTELLNSHQVNELIVALPQPATAELVRLATRCQQRGIGVSVVPQPYELYLSRPRLLDLDGLPILKLCEPSASSMFLKAKRGVDVVVGGALFAFSLFIIVPSALVLRIFKGRGFQWDTRCGQNFEQFKMLRLNVERNAFYESRFERLLDRFSVTELPQLWNVLKGDMSLVGPRPEPPARTRRYTPWEQRRLSVRPGMTGLAQVRGLREEHSSEAKSRLDLQYLLSPSLLTDFSILLQTIWTLATRPPSAGQIPDTRNTVVDIRRPTSPVAHFNEEVDPRADRAQSGAD